MAHFCRTSLAFVWAVLCLALPAGAQLHSIETPDHRLIFYDKTHTYLAPHLMRSFENAFQFHKRTFGYQPRQKVTTLLEDFSDFGHGGADVIPGSRVTFGIAPFSYVYETMPANDRISWMMNHELVHVTEMDAASRTDRMFRKLFSGKVSPASDDPLSMAYGFLTTPRRYSPRWYHEGLAAFMETWMAGGFGRALGGYDEMVFRTLVHDRSRIYDVVGLEAEGTTSDFMVGANSYLYGTRFMNYVASRHSPEKLLQWIRRTDQSKRYFSAQFREVFGQPLKKEWEQWIAEEHKWQEANLALIRKYPVTPVKRILEEPLGSVSRPFYDAATGTLYAAVRYPGQMGHIAAIDVDTGAIRKVHDIEGPALYYVCGLAFDASTRTFFYSTSNNNWRSIYSVRLDDRKPKLLVKNARTGDLALNPGDKSLWGTRHANGLTALVRMAPPYHEWKIVAAFPYGTDVYDLDFSPDGASLTTALVGPEGKQQLVRFSVARLMAGDKNWEVIRDFEYSSPANFVYSPDGRYLYGTSYETGVSNIFRVDLQTKELAALSNSETGLFRPLPLRDGSLIAFEYTAKGFVPVRLHPQPIEDVSAVKYLGQQVVEKHPEVKNWTLPAESSIDLVALTSTAGVYRPMRQLKLMSAYPIVQGYKDGAAPGVRLNVSDDLNLAGIEGTFSVSPESRLRPGERFHAGLAFHYWAWKVKAFYNNADFYDLFGPTKNSRKGYSLALEHTRHFLYAPPRTLDFTWGVAGYGGLERLPEYQNVATAVRNMLTARTSLRYAYLEKSLGAVDDEKGYIWELGSRTTLARNVFPRVFANFDYGFLTPIHNSPVWIRNSAGRAFGNREQPFGNFFFGGYGNNWVDRLDVSRYRDFYSFPGVELNEIGAHDYAKSLVEWNLPPLRFAHFGGTWLYCNWARLTLFGSGLVSNMAHAPSRNFHANAGSQLDFRIVLFSYLNSTFSVGYAGATDRHGRTSGEFMVSLKLL